MSTRFLNIDTDELVVWTNKLEKLHRSALPVAIRSTLNSAAFDVKQNTMPTQAQQKFTNRTNNFFKANSRVKMASGFDVKNMKSVVGFMSDKLKNGSSNFAVKNLEQQENGGVIEKKSFIPTDQARGGNNSKLVRPSNRLSRINAVKSKGGLKGFAAAARKAGKGGYIITNNALVKVTSIRKGRIKTKMIYSFEKNRKVRVKGTAFMKTASLKSSKKMESFFITNAKNQIQRLRK